MKSIICGLDEVGRGALAGPLVLASVTIHDSKTLSQMQRTKALKFINANAIKIDIEIITIEQINQIRNTLINN